MQPANSRCASWLRRNCRSKPRLHSIKVIIFVSFSSLHFHFQNKLQPKCLGRIILQYCDNMSSQQSHQMYLLAAGPEGATEWEWMCSTTVASGWKMCEAHHPRHPPPRSLYFHCHILTIFAFAYLILQTKNWISWNLMRFKTERGRKKQVMWIANENATPLSNLHSA